MKLAYIEDGYCRVYYKDDRQRLFCYQDDGRAGVPAFRFYACTDDGEPSHEVKPPADLPLPTEANGSTARDLLAWLRARP